MSGKQFRRSLKTKDRKLTDRRLKELKGQIGRLILCMDAPDRAHISTSHTERQNLTMRVQMRRFTRLTNAFSKKIENHEAAIALHYMHYNFARVHQTLRVTPAMEAGISNHVWSLQEIVALLKVVNN